MERKVISSVAILCGVAVLSCVVRAGTYSGGSGTTDDPYRIASATDILALSGTPNDWSKNFLMMGDISLGGRRFDCAIISPGSNSPFYEGTMFTGVFDGGGHVLSGFQIKTTGRSNWLGVFGMIGPTGVVQNLGIVGISISDIQASNGIGILAGENSGIIQNCYSRGQVTIGRYSGSIGGLVGVNSGTLLNSFAECSVAASWFASSSGVLAGSNSGTILNCYSKGSINGDGGHDYGGLVGTNVGFVMNCYSTVFVSGRFELGGLVARSSTGVVVHSYWDVDQSQISYSPGGGEGKSSEEMMSSDLYRLWGYCQCWTISEGNEYPHLSWEAKPGVPISPPTVLSFPGEGLPDNPYLISQADELMVIGSVPSLWDKSFRMTGDIDLSGYPENEITLIGGTGKSPFIGSFDGGGFVLNGFHYTCTLPEGGVGLIRRLGPDGLVQNVRLANVRVETNGGSVGGIVGLNDNGIVANCHVSGMILGKSNYQESIGGVVGTNSGMIQDSSFAGSVVSSSYGIGGLVGIQGYPQYGLIGGTIERCYALGIVSGSDGCGGLVGTNYSGKIRDSFADMKVSGTYAGGLVCWNSSGTIENSYSLGVVTGSTIGGCVTKNYGGGEVLNCFWDVDTSGVVGGEGGIGLHSNQMKTLNIFLGAGWDFDGETTNGTKDIWKMIDGLSYPSLEWSSSIVLSDENLQFTFFEADTEVHSQSIRIGNLSHAQMEWTLNLPADCPWIFANPSGGSLNVGESEEVILTLDTWGLKGGKYSCDMTVSAPGLESKSMSVNLSIIGPIGRTEPTEFIFRGSMEDEKWPEPQTLTIHNIGGGSLAWSIDSDIPSWLTVSPKTGTLQHDELQTITLTADPSELAFGFYQSDLVIRTPGAASATMIIPVSLGWSSRQEIMIPRDYPTIQTAVDAAAPGVTILLSDGIFTGTGNRGVTINKPLTIRGIGGPERCIIDCEGVTRAFTGRINEPNSLIVFEGLTLRNGISESEDPNGPLGKGNGGAVLLNGRGTALLKNCIMVHNRAYVGGAVCCLGEWDLRMERCKVEGNGEVGADGWSDWCEAGPGESVQGGGLYGESGKYSFEHCAFIGNVCIGGDAGHCWDDECGCSGDHYGGYVIGTAIQVNGTVDMHDCLIIGNYAKSGKGFAVFPYEASNVLSIGDGIIANCTIWGNRTEGYYGARLI
ncbi:MAG: hypothetical protein GX455_14065 [Phycisphaerae bacterium]|nr:hypothetical protein [Phycisphaerae bacterium]